MRDKTFSVLKALAIILVVVSHSGAPAWLNRFIFQFHVPVFFICAGYFFGLHYLDDGRQFVRRRFTGLYVPFVKWSLILLVLHNLFFAIGLLNEQYGNASGGVLHPYNWHDFFQNIWNITTGMQGYDVFIGGAFWFFRALLVASLVFWLGLKFFRWLRPTDTLVQSAALLAVTMGLLIVWKIAAGLKIPALAGGGYRELLGVMLMSFGLIYRQCRSYIPLNWKTGLAATTLTVLGAIYVHASMASNADFGAFFGLLVPAMSGFMMLHYVSSLISAHLKPVETALAYVGERTLYVFAWHLLAFKLVSIIKVAAYGLPWLAVGGHTVVNHATDDLFWLLYTIAGIGVPLGCLALYRYYAKTIDFSTKSCVKYAIKGLIKLCYYIFIGIKKSLIYLWQCLVGFWRALKDIVKASSPNEE